MQRKEKKTVTVVCFGTVVYNDILNFIGIILVTHKSTYTLRRQCPSIYMEPSSIFQYTSKNPEESFFKESMFRV